MTDRGQAFLSSRQARLAKRALPVAGNVGMASIERAREQTVTLHFVPVRNEQHRCELGEMHLTAHLH